MEPFCDLFRAINVMTTGTSIVGNSKVFHHLLPNIVPPIDRRYTLKFLFGQESAVNNMDAAWRTVQTIIADFFAPLIHNPKTEALIGRWIDRSKEFQWDILPMKVIDNLVLGAQK